VNISKNVRADFKRLIEQNDTPAGQTFNWVVLGLIVYSAFTLSVETLPDLSPALRRLLEVSETVVTVRFTLEYLLRLYTAENKLRYVFRFHGFIDLIAELPFYLPLGIDLRSARIIRLLRVFRLLKMARYNRALHRVRSSLRGCSGHSLPSLEKSRFRPTRVRLARSQGF
jgi:voltage-gated potassium channel